MWRTPQGTRMSPWERRCGHHGEAKALEQDSKLRLQGRARLQKKRGGLGAGKTKKAWTLAQVTPGSGRAEQGEA